MLAAILKSHHDDIFFKPRKCRGRDERRKAATLCAASQHILHVRSDAHHEGFLNNINAGSLGEHPWSSPVLRLFHSICWNTIDLVNHQTRREILYGIEIEVIWGALDSDFYLVYVANCL